MKDLLRIASMLDNSGQFYLSDKLFRIAQTAPVNKPTIDENFYLLPTDMKLRKQQELNFALKQFNVKQRDLQERYKSNQIPRDQYAKELNALSKELQSFKPQIDIVNNYIRDNNQNPQKYMGNEQQNVNLSSNSPQEFADNLLTYAEQNNLTNLMQAFDLYAKSGAMYGNNPLTSDPRLQKLYQVISQTNRFITKDEIARTLQNIIDSRNSGNSQQESVAYEELRDSVMMEPLSSMQLLKSQIQNYQNITEQQKAELISVINNRIIVKK
jgi:hypothetical protein